MKVKFILKNKVEIIHTVEDKYYDFFKEWSEHENKDCALNDCSGCCWSSVNDCIPIKHFNSEDLESIEFLEIPVKKTKYYLWSYPDRNGSWFKCDFYISKDFKKGDGEVMIYLESLPDDQKICHENEFISI